jgi:hypothetical protein
MPELSVINSRKLWLLSRQRAEACRNRLSSGRKDIGEKGGMTAGTVKGLSKSSLSVMAIGLAVVERRFPLLERAI